MDIVGKLNQTAVAWTTATPDGYGGYTFSSVDEIDCRWNEKQELFINAQGQEELSRAIVYVNQDMEVGEYLYLGSEDDLDSDHDDPQVIEDAYIIKAFQKIPSIDGTEFLRRCWL